MPITRSADAPTWQLPGTVFTGLASPSRGDSTDVAVWLLHMESGTPPTPHSVTRTEVFAAVAGSAQVRLANGPLETINAGDTLVVPADTPFELGTAETTFEAIVCLPRGGQAAMPGAEPFTPPWSA